MYANPLPYLKATTDYSPAPQTHNNRHRLLPALPHAPRARRLEPPNNTGPAAPADRRVAPGGCRRSNQGGREGG